MSTIEQIITYTTQKNLATENEVFSELGMKLERIERDKNECEYTPDSLEQSINEVKDIKTSLCFLQNGDFPLVVESYIEQAESILAWYKSAFE